MSRRTDEQWLQDLRTTGASQRQAFTDLGRYLFTVVYNYLRQRQEGVPRLRDLDASELEELARGFAQEALQVIWEKLSTYEGRGKLTSWAATIAVRTAAYEVRKPYWREARIDPPAAQRPEDGAEPRFRADPTWHIALQPSPEALLETAEVLDHIRAALHQDLTERQRFAFLAQFVEDRSSDDIADELGVTRNAVYLLIYEARKKINRRLLEAGHTPEDVLRVFQAQ